LKEHPKTQPDKFKEAARKLGADEDEAAFEERLRKIAKVGANKAAPAKRGS
jgi:hypothetical protein